MKNPDKQVLVHVAQWVENQTCVMEVVNYKPASNSDFSCPYTHYQDTSLSSFPQAFYLQTSIVEDFNT